MKMKIRKSLSFFLVFAMIATLMMPLQIAFAGLLNLSNAMSTVRANVLSNHTIVFRTPTGVDAPADTITVTFPTGFGMGTFALLNFDLAASAGGQSACPAGGATPAYTERTLATAPAAGNWGVSQSGQVVTFTAPTDAAAGNIPTHACVRIRIGNNATHGGTGAMQITNHATAGTYTMTIAGTFGDSGSIAVSIILDDRVAVTADVAATITFAISDLTIGFGTLISTGPRFADGTGAGSGTEVVAHNFTVSTNAASGYTVALSGATLTSGANTITEIGATAAASSPGSEQFGLRITATAGTGTVTAPYNTANFALDTAAFPDEVAASPSASVTTTFDVRYLANISATTEAGTYTTNLTYTATGRF
jgi:hypothetical protein